MKKIDTGPRAKSLFVMFAEACVVYIEPTLVLQDSWGDMSKYLLTPERHQQKTKEVIQINSKPCLVNQLAHWGFPQDHDVELIAVLTFISTDFCRMFLIFLSFIFTVLNHNPTIVLAPHIS